MSNRFSDNPKAEYRALQMWIILVSAAKNRQTVTYKLLANRMGYDKAAGVLANSLGHIAYYCKQKDLPALTSIVVNGKTGLPGDGIPLKIKIALSEREKSFGFDWFNVIPPSPKELKLAADAGRGKI